MLDEQERLLGIVTRSELFSGFEQGKESATQVEDLMLSDPVMLTPDRAPLTAAELMYQHAVYWLPVVEDKETRR